VTTHVPKAAARFAPPLLREGTAVRLISVEDLSGKTAKDAGPIAFVLANDLEGGGVTVAKAGAKAWGRASYGGAGEGMHVGLEGVELKVGSAGIPLRSTQSRRGGGEIEYSRVEDSGRIAIVLYVARSVALTPAQ